MRWKGAIAGGMGTKRQVVVEERTFSLALPTMHDIPNDISVHSRPVKSLAYPVISFRECQGRKSVPQRPPGRLVPIPPAIAPFHRIGIDLLGRFPKSAYGNKWIIVCTDYSTRYAITKALPTAEVDEIAKFLLEEIVLRHGAPRVIITDRGAVFSRSVSSISICQ
ncbi:transposon Tf2-8 polyprotein [Trichonephila clavipes]|nr:transposon Tf2-8 polyprotein [Trichonephila clavipes]